MLLCESLLLIWTVFGRLVLDLSIPAAGFGKITPTESTRCLPFCLLRVCVWDRSPFGRRVGQDSVGQEP